MSELNGGLVGAGSSVVRTLRAHLPSGNKLALGLVFFAGLITVIKKASPGSIPDYAVYFGISLGVAALLYEMTASKDMIRAWWNGRAGSMFAAGAIWFCAFAFSINNWIGAASESQVERSNIHKTALMETQAVTGNLADAEARLNRLRASREELSAQPIEGVANTKPWRTPQAAQAVVDTSEAHRWFTGLTAGCTKTTGPQTRTFCGKYHDAKADVARWADIAKLEIEIGDAESEVRNARLAVSNANIETSEVRGDSVLLVRYGGLSEADAQTLDGLFAVIVISILLSFGSMRSEHEELAKHGPRTPFSWGLKLRRAFSRTVYGREPGDVQVIVEKTVEQAPQLVSRSMTLRQIVEGSGTQAQAA